MRRWLLVAAAAVVACAFLAAVAPARVAAQATACGPGGNPVACENTQPGTPPASWDVGPGEGGTIQGFSDPFSVNSGGAISFKISTTAASYAVDIYRMGYYGGDGARLIASVTPNVSVSRSQPACATSATTGLIDCGDWKVSASWTVPATAVSGVYFAHIYRTDGSSDENQIPFVVRDDASHSAVVYKTADTTWQAYNDWSGNSLYVGDASQTGASPLDPGRAEQVSYNRPFATRFDTPGGQDYFFYAEYPTIRFLEENGYDVSYVDSATVAGPSGAALLEQHKALVTAGHDEYWSSSEVSNVTAARDAGVSMAFFTGNEVYWKTRWGADSNGEQFRTLITYKESLDSARTDPDNPPTWTGAWWDPRYSPPADGGRPQNALTGQLWIVNAGSYPITVPYSYAKLRFWRDTQVASLQPGQTATLPDETLGYEWDTDADNGFRPPGLIEESATTQTAPQVVSDYQEDLAAVPVTHHLTLYRTASGALVFGAGTVQWAWGLDSTHDGDANNPASVIMQQATVNLLADMGAQPATLMSGLAQASASADTTPPASAITSPSAGAPIASGSRVTVTGTATDSGGGVVAGVEISADGGASWHPVTSMSPAAASVTWSYTWDATGLGQVTIETRATDDSGNTETPHDPVAVVVSCPCGLYGQAYTPAVTAESDSTPLELGVKFTASVPGWVAGVRFYKGSGNNGTHTASLWSASGTQLATGTFTGETASGWQTLLFANPVQISANTTYVASYFDPDGHYADDVNQFFPGPTGSVDLPPLDSPPLAAVRATATVGNGVFNVGGPGFPTSSFNGTGYGVDVIFDTSQPPGAPPAVTGQTPYPGSSSNPVSTDPTVTFSKPVVPSTLSLTVTGPGGQVAGSVSFDGTDTTATFTPASQLAAGTTFTVTASGEQDQFGQVGATASYTFITAKAAPPPGACPCSIWTDGTIPPAPDSGDGSAVTLGVRFSPSENGYITGVRFYKSIANAGTHTGVLWSATGAVLASGTFSSESTQGWQELDFATKVAVTAGTTYVAGYSAPDGHYAMTASGLAGGLTSGPLTVPGGANGVYTYGPGTAFPSSSFNGSNYWVDVVFAPLPDTSPPQVATSAPSPGATSVPVTSDVTVTFNKQVEPGSATATVTGPGGAVAGTSSLDAAGKVLTFGPSAALAPGTRYTVTVSGATSMSGVTMSSPASWQFSTSGTAACPCTLWESDAAPATPSSADSAAVTLGMRFSPDANGWISGVRFYKGTGNSGPHIGSLWSAAGTLLAQGTFTGETASGWQTLEFPAAVPVTAGTSYVVSYYAPNGHYADDSGYFSASGTDNSPLHAPSAGNGLFAYGGNQFPNSSFQGSNYWVDPVFWSTQPPDLAAPQVSSVNPVPGQTSVPQSAPVAFVFDKAVQPNSISFALTGPAGGSVPGSLAYDAASDTATFTPSAPLASATGYTATVSAATDTSGLTMTAPRSWTFTTAQPAPPPGQCPCSIWPDSAQPSIASASDPSPVEVGVKFAASTSGWITGIRFYKGQANTGTHVGSLWDASGNLLAQVTFGNESVAGWQQANLATPVAVTAGTTYVVSYFAPDGGYAMDQGAFASGVVNAPLAVPSSAASGGNGLYSYTSSPAFPVNSFNATNYWVDVVFSTTPP